MMKLFSVFIFVSFFLAKMALAGSEVPGIGSVWESTSVYPPNAEGGSPPRKETEAFKVDRMQEGRPVFSGKMLGLEGEIIESTEGTIIYALECKNEVPKEMLVPPTSPNQCVGHVCVAPAVGDAPLVRKTFIYVPLFGCQRQEGEYTFTSVRVEGKGESALTVGDASFSLNGTLRGSWKSYIKKGEGQVFAESPVKVTTYDKVIVHLVPYRSGTASTVSNISK